MSKRTLKSGMGVRLVVLLAILVAAALAIQPISAQSIDGRPVIDEAPATFTHAENDEDAVYTFLARDPEGKQIFWTLSGADAADFTIDGGTLMFKSAPNFEMPTDRADATATPAIAGTNNVYNVTIRFSDGGAPAGTHSVKVTVTNEEEDGMVSISPMQPQVGTELTATVTDPDGNVQAEYQWSKSDVMDGTFADIDGADEMTYTPTEDDVDSYLRVTARYVDGHGTPIDSEMATATRMVRADTTANAAPVVPDQDISNTTTDQAADTTPTRFVLENMTPGTEVGPPVTAVDDNLDELTYAFGGTADQLTAAEPFNIDPVTGQITTNRALNSETDTPGTLNTYAVVVMATDADGDVISTQAITITVSNVDEAPVFGTAFRELNLAENSTALDSDGDATNDPETITYTATDPEGATPIIWSLEGPDSEWFEISDAGVLTVESARDFESPTDANSDNVYELTVVAADSQYDDAKMAELLVTVKVTDVVEGQSPGSITIFNLQPEVGTNLFLEGPLTDSDGVTGAIQWQWYSLNAACPDAATVAGIDFADVSTSYDPDVNSDSSWAKITVSDATDDSDYTPRIDDHTGADGTGTADCLMVRASYVDNGPPGVDDISTTNHDESRQYAYAVSANAVQAEDDSNLKPMFDDGDDSTQGIQTRARIAENATDLTIVAAITPVVAETPPDTTTTGAVGATGITIGLAEDDNAVSGTADTLTYTLGGTDEDSFTINKVTGVVTMDDAPNYEDQDSYTFIVLATDPTNAKSDQDPRRTNGITVILEVTDVDEVAQFTAMPTHVVYEENGTGPVAAYPASDPDDDSFIWELAAHSGGTDDSGDFEISQLDGSLKFMNSPDFEDPNGGGPTGTSNIYQVAVNLRQDTDNDGDIDTSDSVVDTVDVLVKVVDVPEAPDFTSDTVTLNIDENQYPDMMLNRAVMGSPQAYDDDANRSVSLEYTLSGPGLGAFSIVPATGELRTAQVLDFERLADPSYEVTVTATDPTGLSDSIDVTIDVNNVDEPPVAGGPNHAPEFPSATMTREVAENTMAGMAIGDPVMATDPENQGITYSLGGADSGHFGIDTMTGQLMTSGALDYEATKNSYTVTVTAMDDDEMDPMSGMTTVTINVTNVDEDGTVTLSTQEPMVNMAITATLEDDDGTISGEDWQWEKSTDKASWMSATGAGAMTDTYTPAAADVDYYLRATVTYVDAGGAGQMAMSESTGSMTVDSNPLLTEYDGDKDGWINRDEAIEALRDYRNREISRDDVIEVLTLYRLYRDR